jgi:hypothetical protein
MVSIRSIIFKYSRGFMLDRLLIILLLLIVFIIITTSIPLQNNNTIITTNAYAHIFGSRIQQWINPYNNVKIQFVYEPENPLIYSLTDLKFSVQHIQTGKHLTDLYASITVANGQKILKRFNNISAPNGDFSVSLKFLETGTYQVIVRVDSKGNYDNNNNNVALALASFKILVPNQPLGIINVNYMTPLLVPAGLAAIIGVGAVVMLLMIAKRGGKKRKRTGEEENNNTLRF